mmetsp:Transcript_14013/g.37461  ORF Transcript_14013/g.37461 Transcript_14013/m.37461 type:complete len:231 (+) Transcript_14013:1288-1980(+)
MLLEERGGVDVAADGDRAGEEAGEEGAGGADVEACGGADGDAAGEGGVCDVDGVEFSAVEFVGEVECGDGGAEEREDGVDEAAVLVLGGGGFGGADEGGPEEPEDGGAEEREEVGDLVRECSVVCGGGAVGCGAECEAGGEAEVGAEHVDGDGAADVFRGDGAEDEDGLVEGVECRLRDADDEHLERGDAADERAEGDEQGGGGELRVDECRQRDGHGEDGVGVARVARE